jgi:hypothetical protein
LKQSDNLFNSKTNLWPSKLSASDERRIEKMKKEFKEN